MESDETTQRYVSLAEVKNILKKVGNDREELLYEQRIALDHCNKFVKLNIKKTNDMIKELKNIEFINDYHAYKIADLLPTNADDIKAIFAKERITVGENDIKKILEIVNKYYIK